MLKRCFYVAAAAVVMVSPGGLLVGAVGGVALVASSIAMDGPSPNLKDQIRPGPVNLRAAQDRDRSRRQPNLRTVYRGV